MADTADTCQQPCTGNHPEEREKLSQPPSETGDPAPKRKKSRRVKRTKEPEPPKTKRTWAVGYTAPMGPARTWAATGDPAAAECPEDPMEGRAQNTGAFKPLATSNYTGHADGVRRAMQSVLVGALGEAEVERSICWGNAAREAALSPPRSPTLIPAPPKATSRPTTGSTRSGYSRGCPPPAKVYGERHAQLLLPKPARPSTVAEERMRVYRRFCGTSAMYERPALRIPRDVPEFALTTVRPSTRGRTGRSRASPRQIEGGTPSSTRLRTAPIPNVTLADMRRDAAAAGAATAAAAVEEEEGNAEQPEETEPMATGLKDDEGQDEPAAGEADHNSSAEDEQPIAPDP